MGAVVVTVPALTVCVIAGAYICITPAGVVVPDDTVPQDESVPLVVRYFPLFPVWLGSKAFTAAPAVVCPVPPLDMDTVAKVVLIDVAPLPVTSPVSVTA